MALEEDIVNWSKDRPAWQREVMRRTAAGVLLSNDDYDQLVDEILNPPDDGPGSAFGLEHLPRATTEDPPVRIVSIAKPEHVNALASDRPLTAKVFCRTYAFLSSVIPYNNAQWEKLSIFLDLVTPKLPAPQEEDLAKGILEAIDMDSYRVEKKAAMKIALADTDAEIEPVPTDARGHKFEPELDRLSNILKTFNEQFGTTFADSDRIFKHIRDDIAPKVAADAAFQNAKANTPHTARMAHDEALGKAAQGSMKDFTQFYKQFVENDSFRRFVGDMVYQLSSQSPMRGPL